jgi:hypothetical protein
LEFQILQKKGKSKKKFFLFFEILKSFTFCLVMAVVSFEFKDVLFELSTIYWQLSELYNVVLLMFHAEVSRYFVQYLCGHFQALRLIIKSFNMEAKEQKHNY